MSGARRWRTEAVLGTAVRAEAAAVRAVRRAERANMVKRSRLGAERGGGPGVKGNGVGGGVGDRGGEELPHRNFFVGLGGLCAHSS